MPALNPEALGHRYSVFHPCAGEVGWEAVLCINASFGGTGPRRAACDYQDQGISSDRVPGTETWHVRMIRLRKGLVPVS